MDSFQNSVHLNQCRQLGHCGQPTFYYLNGYKTYQMKKVFFTILIPFIISCNAYKDIPVSSLRSGMNLEECQQIVKKPLIQTSMDKNKTSYSVQKRIVRGGIARQQRYSLFFENGKLVKYEKESENFSL